MGVTQAEGLGNKEGLAGCIARHLLPEDAGEIAAPVTLNRLHGAQ